MDVAATQLHSDGVYAYEGSGRTCDEMIAIYADLVANYPIVSIEDPLSEDELNVVSMTTQIHSKIQIVSDDLFVTNPERLEDGIARGAANALLVKVNQIGTCPTLDAVTLAHDAGYRCLIVTGRESQDVTIADLAVATGCGQIKKRARRPDQRNGSPSTTSCCASRKTSATPPAISGSRLPH